MFVITNNAARVRRERIMDMTILPKDSKFGLVGFKTSILKPDRRWVGEDQSTTQTIPNRKAPNDHQAGTR